ncbi:MAG: hypothetical protein ACT4NY_00885 [Pseudonocardiales bacterium]
MSWPRSASQRPSCHSGWLWRGRRAGAEAGLYTMLAAALLFSLVTSTRFVSVGPSATLTIGVRQAHAAALDGTA